MLEVFTIGGGEYLVNIFNAVAAWSGGGGYRSLIRVVLVMGLIYSLLAGFGLMGRLVALDAIANADREVLIGHVGRAIQAYCDGAPAGVRQPGGPGRGSAR